MAQSDTSLAPETISRQQDTPSAAKSPWARNARQFGLFLAGAGFMAASVAVTRRAVIRRQLDSLPKFYSSNRHRPKLESTDKQLLAVHAFSLATLNVMSFGIMLVGGISWAFNLNSVEELRQRTQDNHRRLAVVPTNPEEEKALEDMMDNFLAKLGMANPKDAAPTETPQSTDTESE